MRAKLLSGRLTANVISVYAILITAFSLYRRKRKRLAASYNCPCVCEPLRIFSPPLKPQRKVGSGGLIVYEISGKREGSFELVKVRKNEHEPLTPFVYRASLRAALVLLRFALLLARSPTMS